MAKKKQLVDRSSEALEIITAARKAKKNIFKALTSKGFTDSEAIEYCNPLRVVKEATATTPTGAEIKYEESKSSASIESRDRQGVIKTLNDLLTTAKVDLTMWEVDRHVINQWSVGAKDDKGVIQVTPLWQVKCWLVKKKSADTIKELVEFFKTEIISLVPENQWDHVSDAEQNPEAKYCLELAIPDLHLGKLVWGEETGGASYDSNEAVRIFKDAVNDLIQKAPMDIVEKIVLTVGNDFYNVDGEDQATTAGTPQSEDTRWQNTFKKGCKLLIETISKLSISHPVQVVLIQGNHDYERSFYLGEYLSAYFNNHPNVTIDNTPTLRKYFRYGATLIGWTHGDKEVRKQLALIMATERKEDWSQVLFKEFHCGHLHKEGDDEIMGVKIRTISSLCSTDAWHASKGYIGQTRSAKAFLYHFDRGLEAQYYHNLI